MQIIDFHTHVYPPKIADKASRSIRDFYGLEKYWVGTPENLLKWGGEAGVTRFVLLQVSIKPEQTHHINQFALDEMRAHAAFSAFGAIHPQMPDVFGELDFLRENGFLGVKMHPDMQQINIDDPQMFPIYDALQGVMPIYFHCGDKKRDFSNPRRLHRVMQMFPRLQVIAAHLGGWSVFDLAYECLKDTDCFVDTCSCSPYLSREEFTRHIREYGADRVLFGTDFPIWQHKTEVEVIDSLPLTDDEKEKIFCGNALQFLR